ncbi:MAG TPA: hypothetical protein RMH99_30710 [Sandaracinaceae bacterium LLY-WYZ-13_1]|nr:hypothetical protein [Sandaracinaceae bacterium LLY-WYZ-13_1]
MRGLPTVAQVLLVAHPSRQRELEPYLHVRDEDVAYDLCSVALDEVPTELAVWDVVVVDGASFLDDSARLRVLRDLGRRPRLTSVLYVCSRLPLETELAYAGFWCDDLIYPGWAHPERVRRRVQVVALAPWRRAAAARRRAEQLGDERLRVLSGPRRAPIEMRDDSLEPPLRGRVTPEFLEEAVEVMRRGKVAQQACERLRGDVTRAREAVEAVSADLRRLIGEIASDDHETSPATER